MDRRVRQAQEPSEGVPRLLNTGKKSHSRWYRIGEHPRLWGTNIVSGNVQVGRSTRFELTSGEQANLAALAAGLPLLTYYLTIQDRTFAGPVAVSVALIGASWLTVELGLRQPLSGAHALLVVSLSCLAFAPYAAYGLFWLLLGTTVMFALLIHNLGNHAAKSVTGSIPTVLQLTILPAIYYSVVVHHPPHGAATGVTLLFLAAALLCNIYVNPRSKTAWFLSATEALLFAITVVGALRMTSLVIHGAMHLAPFGYFFALQFLFHDAGEIRGAQEGGAELRR